MANNIAGSSAGAGVAPHLRVLRAAGVCRAPPPRAPLARLYHALSLAATSTYVLQQLLYAYQERNDMNKLSQVMFIMLCHVTCVAKQIVFQTDAARIELLVASLDDESLRPATARGAALVAASARGAARLLRGFASCAVATCVLWVVFALVDRLQGRAVEFPFWIGFQYQHPLVFVCVLSYSFYTTNLVAVANTTMDAFMATVLHQCMTQLKILRMNFEELPQTARLLAESSLQDYDEVLYNMLVKCIIHYKKITECCELLQDIFGRALLVQFGVGGWILCMAAYKIVSLDILSIEFASTTLFIICIQVELFLYCYYGNEVTVQSDLVVRSIYSMEWTRTSARFRRSLLVLMERAQRPLRPAAGQVIPLSLDTFVKILKSSYSFYAVLRQTK